MPKRRLRQAGNAGVVRGQHQREAAPLNSDAGAGQNAGEHPIGQKGDDQERQQCRQDHRVFRTRFDREGTHNLKRILYAHVSRESVIVVDDRTRALHDDQTRIGQHVGFGNTGLHKAWANGADQDLLRRVSFDHEASDNNIIASAAVSADGEVGHTGRAFAQGRDIVYLGEDIARGGIGAWRTTTRSSTRGSFSATARRRPDALPPVPRDPSSERMSAWRAWLISSVWTLPPSLRLGDQDRERYLAIGESDRMTLLFRKPE